jgi:hypothetical protein
MLIGRNARNKPHITPSFKGCVVVQGPTYSQWIKEVKESWIGYQVIYSTWDNADKSLYDESDIVIYNTIPSEAGVKNLNLQKVSTINGFLKAKELGWKRALKARSDFSTKTANGLFELFDKTKLNLHGYWNGYINDFYMEGEIDDIITLFEVDINGPYPEWNLTKKLYDSKLNEKSYCILNSLENGVADIYWQPKQCWFSAHKTNGVVTDVLPQNWG